MTRKAPHASKPLTPSQETTVLDILIGLALVKMALGRIEAALPEAFHMFDMDKFVEDLDQSLGNVERKLQRAKRRGHSRTSGSRARRW